MIIDNVFEAVVGWDFIGTPTTGTNKIIATFYPVYNDGDIIQDTFTEVTDTYQDSFVEGAL